MKFVDREILAVQKGGEEFVNRGVLFPRVYHYSNLFHVELVLTIPHPAEDIIVVIFFFF